jgi:hypothetical protein
MTGDTYETDRAGSGPEVIRNLCENEAAEQPPEIACEVEKRFWDLFPETEN